MTFDKIKNTVTWKNLCVNPKFEEEFNKVIKDLTFYTSVNDINFAISNQKIIVEAKSRIIKRDLDCEYKAYSKIEFSLDVDNSLIINKKSGDLQSNYGYTFKNTIGGRLNTNYSCQIFNDDGIELLYQSYGDGYDLDEKEFKTYQDDFSKVISSTYNPRFLESFDNTELNHPSIVGKYGNLLRKMRSNDNLGIVEVSKILFDKDTSISSKKEELYFNTFYSSNGISPESISFINGFPFATLDKDNVMHFSKDYIELGLTYDNYQLIARERFLKELAEQKGKHKDNQNILNKYDLMIKKLENEAVGSKKI